MFSCLSAVEEKRLFIPQASVWEIYIEMQRHTVSRHLHLVEVKNKQCVGFSGL